MVRGPDLNHDPRGRANVEVWVKRSKTGTAGPGPQSLLGPDQPAARRRPRELRVRGTRLGEMPRHARIGPDVSRAQTAMPSAKAGQSREIYAPGGDPGLEDLIRHGPDQLATG